ncbi:hypothetical protein PTNB85_03706 [Pyrenophora teres f. teres]|uniref:Uncharacterized protein n=1 Tax=Pyrenophora teres f. teres TaxID=97479 RepID=A0A6S6W1M0_9PLEO|nr:hypothetical protein HRS9139_05746 [Pyrenophora teres f. teres]KAE8840307.1 hypothetical protein PTNB85_03706 [Pyrenophora teres f. teres]KAE8863802.1 hypothetical protein PTNB29_03766 [Pyrenophora teres f. teres]CAE7034246.1 hypothetical protein PTTW11_05381 [Pyrenophora teres f. teres]
MQLLQFMFTAFALAPLAMAQDKGCYFYGKDNNGVTGNSNCCAGQKDCPAFYHGRGRFWVDFCSDGMPACDSK